MLSWQMEWERNFCQPYDHLEPGSSYETVLEKYNQEPFYKECWWHVILQDLHLALEMANNHQKKDMIEWIYIKKQVETLREACVDAIKIIRESYRRIAALDFRLRQFSDNRAFEKLVMYRRDLVLFEIAFNKVKGPIIVY